MKVTPTEYNRKKALFRLTEIVRRWFPPGPTLRPADVADVMEAACKQEMPGYHVRVSIERIGGYQSPPSVPAPGDADRGNGGMC